MRSNIKVSTSTMPSGLSRRTKFVLTNVIDNYQSYSFGSDCLQTMKWARDKLYGGLMTYDEFMAVGTAFVCYYKNDDRIKELHLWWNTGVAKDVFEGLGT